MTVEIQRNPTGIFSMGKISPESRNTRRKPPRATTCIAATWLGIVAPTMVPKAATQNVYRIVATMKGVGSPARPKPKYVNRRTSITTHSASATTMKTRIFPSRNSWAEMLEINLKDCLQLTLFCHGESGQQRREHRKSQHEDAWTVKLLGGEAWVVPEANRGLDERES